MADTGDFCDFCDQIDWSEAIGSMIYIDLINRSIFEIMSLWSFSIRSVRLDQAARGRSVLVVSKNTNEPKTCAPGRFGLEVSSLGWQWEPE